MDKAKWKLIEGIDLDGAIAALKARKSWFWKKRNDLCKIEREYRQFLYLIAVNPNKVVVPWSQQLDDLWHEHILDTAKYSEDCDKIFGKFIHHDPHLKKGTKEQKSAFAKTKKMHQESFGSRDRYTAVSPSSCSASAYPIFFDAGGGCSSHHSHSDSSSSAGCGGASCSSGSSCGGGASCGGGGCGGGGD